MNRNAIRLTTLILISVSFQLFLSHVYHTDAITNSKPLANVQGIFLVADHSDYREFQIPKEILEDFGCKITVVGPNYSVISGGGPNFEVDILIDDLNNVSSYEFLYTPGGGGVATIIDFHPEAIELVIKAYNFGLILSAICAGPVVFAYADIISGRNISGNIGVRSEIIQAGANFIPDKIVIDSQFVTCDVAFVYTFAQLGIVKALGFFETDPPVLHGFDTNIIQSNQNNSIYTIVNTSDYFGVASVTLELHKYNKKSKLYELAIETELIHSFVDGLFSGVINQIPDGNYTITVIVEDKLFNVAKYPIDFNFIFGKGNNLSFSLSLIISVCMIFLSSIYIIRKKKQ